LAALPARLFKPALAAVLLVCAFSLALGWQKDWSPSPTPDYREAAAYAGKWNNEHSAFVATGRSDGPFGEYFPASLKRGDWYKYLETQDISPLLANAYLHYTFDLWAERWRRQEAHGDMIIVRYADDLVVGFEHEDDARRFLDAMRERFEAFALTVHPDKTRLIEFGRRAAANRKGRGLGKPETFMFLGLTHICGRSRRGSFLLERKTRRDRLRRKLQDIKEELRRRMHQPIHAQGAWLRQVVTGHFAYYAVPTNGRALSAFRYYVTDLWRRTLRRRSQRGGFTWDRMARLADEWLPQPRILHPWPQQRFAVTYPR